MNPTSVLINFVLDKSGSMTSLRQASIDGFNLFLAEQCEVPGEAWMGLTQFDTHSQIIHIARPISDIAPMTWEDYCPSGGTALLDAVGSTVKAAEEWVTSHRFDGRVIVVTWTDGEENSSQYWHINQPPVSGDDRDLLGLISWKQNEGWEFLFLGAGGSHWLEQTFGSVVASDQIYGYDHSPNQMQRAYAGVTQSISGTRMTGARTTAP